MSIYAESDPGSQLQSQWWVFLLRGIVAVLFGLIALFAPFETFAAILIFFGAFLIIDGAMTIFTAFSRAKYDDKWWLWLFDGILTLALGLMTAFWPAASALALVIWVAAWAIIAGFIRIGAAIRLRKEIDGEWALALSGVATILFGLLMLLVPGAAIAAWSWVLGFFALIVGVSLIALAFRVRKLRPAAHRA